MVDCANATLRSKSIKMFINPESTDKRMSLTTKEEQLQCCEMGEILTEKVCKEH